MKNIQPDFRRVLLFVAFIHGALILGIIYFMRQPVKRLREEVTWLDTGSFGSVTSVPAALPPPLQTTSAVEEEKKSDEKEVEEEAEEVSTPAPVESITTSEPTPEEENTPLLSDHQSEIALTSPTPQLTPKTTPTPSLTPKPTPTPKPRPVSKPHSQSTPEKNHKPISQLTPKPTPKVAVKVASKNTTSEKKSLANKESSAVISKDSHGKNGSKNTASSSSSHDDNSAKAAFLESKNRSGHGSSVGNGSSNDHGEGSGVDSEALGAYHELIHDRFYSQWEQPTTIPTEHKHDFICTLQLTIKADGTISHFSLSKPSGNPVMDASVLAAAGKVAKIAPFPHGVGTGGTYIVNINFELE